MFKHRGIAVRREAFKVVFAGVPEDWHSVPKGLGWVRIFTESVLAVLGIAAVLFNVNLSTPFITLALSILVFFELGRPDIEYKYQTSYVSKEKTTGQGDSLTWNFDPPLTTLNYYYLNGEERVSDEELGLYGSEHIELQIPQGYLDGEIASLQMTIPFSVRKLTIKKEPEKSFQDRISTE